MARKAKKTNSAPPTSRGTREQETDASDGNEDTATLHIVPVSSIDTADLTSQTGGISSSSQISDASKEKQPTIQVSLPSQPKDLFLRPSESFTTLHTKEPFTPAIPQVGRKPTSKPPVSQADTHVGKVQDLSVGSSSTSSNSPYTYPQVGHVPDPPVTPSTPPNLADSLEPLDLANYRLDRISHTVQNLSNTLHLSITGLADCLTQSNANSELHFKDMNRRLSSIDNRFFSFSKDTHDSVSSQLISLSEHKIDDLFKHFNNTHDNHVRSLINTSLAPLEEKLCNLSIPSLSSNGDEKIRIIEKTTNEALKKMAALSNSESHRRANTPTA